LPQDWWFAACHLWRWFRWLHAPTVPLAPLILTIVALCCADRIFLRSQRLMRGQTSGPVVSQSWERGFFVIMTALIGFSALIR
jgi:hypothetical protein